MREYKVVVVSEFWTERRLERKAAEALNKAAREGWRLTHIDHGGNFLAFNLVMVLERDTEA